MGNAGQANYSASKAGVIGTYQKCGKGACVERDHMQCSCTRIIETEMTEAMPEDCQGSGQKNRFRFSGQGRCQMWPVWLHFLASDLADYITGQVISVDGGMHM